MHHHPAVDARHERVLLPGPDAGDAVHRLVELEVVARQQRGQGRDEVGLGEGLADAVARALGEGDVALGAAAVAVAGGGGGAGSGVLPSGLVGLRGARGVGSISGDAPLVPPLVKLLGHRQGLRELAPRRQPSLGLELFGLLPVVHGVLQRVVRHPEHGARGDEEAAVGQGEVAVGDADLSRSDGRVHAEGLFVLCFTGMLAIFGSERGRGRRRGRKGKKKRRRRRRGEFFLSVFPLLFLTSRPRPKKNQKKLQKNFNSPLTIAWQ